MSSFNLDVSSLGSCLTSGQRLAIKNALYALQLNERLDSIQFWGKIIGTENDYFIAVSQSITDKITKTFYWSADNGVTFAKFEPLDAFVSQLAPLVNGLFTGNPALKYRDPTKPKRVNEDGEPIDSDDEADAAEDEGEDKSDDSEETKKKVAPRKVSELERLHHTVQSIEHESAIAPTGSHYLTPTGTIVKNKAFTGLTVASVSELEHYSHWRDSESRDAQVRIRKNRTNNNNDAFDHLVTSTNTTAANQWAIHTDSTGLSVSIRSLVWLGYEFKTEAGSSSYSQAYFGLGERNRDLPFMI